MVRLAVEGVPGLAVDERELYRAGPSWTIDTLLSLREELGEQAQLCFILGQDAFAGLSKWHRWQELLQHCHLLVLQRPDMPAGLPAELQALLQQKQVKSPAALQGPSGQVAMIQQTPLAISATAIRQALENGHCIRYLVPDAVHDYIQQHSLYQAVKSI